MHNSNKVVEINAKYDISHNKKVLNSKDIKNIRWERQNILENSIESKELVRNHCTEKLYNKF